LPKPVGFSRRLANHQLKSTSEAFIDYCGDFLIGSIRVYLAKVIETYIFLKFVFPILKFVFKVLFWMTAYLKNNASN
jgi:hypothetical protein